MGDKGDNERDWNDPASVSDGQDDSHGRDDDSDDYSPMDAGLGASIGALVAGVVWVAATWIVSVPFDLLIGMLLITIGIIGMFGFALAGGGTDDH